MIKFIYFDVGGVVIKDFSKTNKWDQMLSDLNISGSKKEQFEKLFTPFESEACIGRNIQEFVEIAAKELEINFPKDYSFLNDFVNRFETNKSLWPIIKKIQEKYRIGLLTNMYPEMLGLIYERDLMPAIDFDVIIDSSVVKFRKPQDEIFKIAENLAKCDPSEILFIENSQMHIDAAKKRGWQTFIYDPADVEEPNNKLKAKLL